MKRIKNYLRWILQEKKVNTSSSDKAQEISSYMELQKGTNLILLNGPTQHQFFKLSPLANWKINTSPQDAEKDMLTYIQLWTTLIEFVYLTTLMETKKHLPIYNHNQNLKKTKPRRKRKRSLNTMMKETLLKMKRRNPRKMRKKRKRLLKKKKAKRKRNLKLSHQSFPSWLVDLSLRKEILWLKLEQTLWSKVHPLCLPSHALKQSKSSLSMLTLRQDRRRSSKHLKISIALLIYIRLILTTSLSAHRQVLLKSGTLMLQSNSLNSSRSWMLMKDAKREFRQ